MIQKKETPKQIKLPEDFDYTRFRKEVISGLIAGKTLTGETGIFQIEQRV